MKHSPPTLFNGLLYRRERAYHHAFRDWQQYEHWKAHRNPKRAALEMKMGFDGKHASPLVRPAGPE